MELLYITHYTATSRTATAQIGRVLHAIRQHTDAITQHRHCARSLSVNTSTVESRQNASAAGEKSLCIPSCRTRSLASQQYNTVQKNNDRNNNNHNGPNWHQQTFTHSRRAFVVVIRHLRLSPDSALTIGRRYSPATAVSLVTLRELSPQQTMHTHCTHSHTGHQRTGSVHLADQGERGCGQSNNRPPACSKYWSVHWLLAKPLHVEAVHEDNQAATVSIA